LMLTKSARYYFDNDAVREPSLQLDPNNEGYRPAKIRGYKNRNTKFTESGGAKYFGLDFTYKLDPAGRNIRSVWTINTQSFSGAHFATFPEKIPETCIKASTPEVGCCSKCGSPYERVVERVSTGKSYATGKSSSKRGSGLATAFSGYDDGSSCPEFKTLGWRPTCSHKDAPTVPSLVLDPFSGSATTLAVAKRLGRHAVGYDLSLEYCELGRKRVEAVTAPMPGLFV